MPQPTMTGLFKVLVDMNACHGGWRTYRPGVWMPTVQEPQVCMRGYHLTIDPLRWWVPRATLWVAQGRGVRSSVSGDKAAWSSVRLLSQVTRKWPLLDFYPRIRAFLAATARSTRPRSNIRWANLAGADVSYACLAGANLSETNLTRANLTWANLIGANLTGADLTGANLTWASLTGANLTRANLKGANLTGADLTGAIRKTTNVSLTEETPC